MLFRMLKKDLSKKRVMNCILTLFILLATLFVASGISNVITVMNGSVLRRRDVLYRYG